MRCHFARALRTASSERFLIDIDGNGQEDDAVLDLHYMADGSVVGTLIVLNHADANEETIVRVLEEVDQFLLPSVSVEQGNLRFTVVKATVVGDYGPMSSG